MPDEPKATALALDIFDHLSSPQQSTLERVIAQDGQGCDLNQQFLKALCDRHILRPVMDELTQGIRLCQRGCGHACYEFLEDMQALYEQWSAQWHEAEVSESSEHVQVPHEAGIAKPIRSLKRSKDIYWARIMNPLYGRLDLFGQSYDQGELLELPEHVSEDAAIRRLDYVMVAPADRAYLRAACGVCGREFLNEHFRDRHGTLRHGNRFAEDIAIAAGMQGPEGGAALRDTTGDAADRRQWVEYPPNLERSKASQQA